MQRWYAARTKPRAEVIASEELSRDGLEIFSPRIKYPVPSGGYSDGPLFPGYLFLRCDPEENGWPVFHQSHRILGWLNFDGIVPWLPDEVIDKLIEHTKEMNNEGGLWKRYRVGETVNIISNSVSGLAEVLEEAKSPQSRVKVLLEFMGRLVPAQISWENIRPVGSINQEPADLKRAPRRTRGRGRWVRGFGPSSALTS